MRNVSARFLAAVGESHRMNTRARVVAPGQTGTTPQGTVIPISSGDLTFDVTAQAAALDLTTTWSWPVNWQDLLTPYGNEIYVERGVTYGDGSTEWVGLGYYRIQSVEQADAPLGPIEILGSDRCQGLVDSRITSPITFTAGSVVSQVIMSLITAVYPSALFDYDPVLDSQTLAVDQITTDDRYGFIDDLITSYGMIWYADYRGYFYIHYPPSATQPVTTINSGRNGVLCELSRTLDRTAIYNGCVVTGQTASSTAPVTAILIDNNPLSPTYWYGPFGQVPQFITSSTVATQTQADQAASTALALSTGLPYEVDFGIVPNPALVLYDPITVAYQGNAHVENHILKQIVIGLAASDLMTAQTRQQVTGVFTAL